MLLRRQNASSTAHSGPSDCSAPSLRSALAHAAAPEIADFWGKVRVQGTPLPAGPGASPGTGRWTFVHRAAGADRVHLAMNRVTDKDRTDAGLMQPVPGTDLWVLTLELPDRFRAAYGFTRLERGQEPPAGPPGHGAFHTRPDPLNPRPPLMGRGGAGLSVFTGPQAPLAPAWDRQTPGARPGRLLQEDRVLPDSPTARPHWLHLPPGDGEVPLLTLFDAEKWFGGLGLPEALEAARASGELPRVAVLGVGHHDRQDRISSLSANPGFLRAVARDATAWAEAHLEAAGLRVGGSTARILAGQSLGGLSALAAAVEQPGHYDALVAQSPSLWWRPGGGATPRDLVRTSGPDWITDRLARSMPDGGPRPVRAAVRVSVGSLEGPSAAHQERLLQALTGSGWDAHLSVYCGGHDYAWWRVGLFDDLRALLGPGVHPGQSGTAGRPATALAAGATGEAGATGPA